MQYLEFEQPIADLEKKIQEENDVSMIQLIEANFSFCN